MPNLAGKIFWVPGNENRGDTAAFFGPQEDLSKL
jgi:hypothetical protein